MSQDRQQLWLVQVVLSLLVDTVWRSTIGRGPLEALAALLDRTARRAVTSRRRVRVSERV
jgi:hypothetical protein